LRRQDKPEEGLDEGKTGILIGARGSVATTDPSTKFFIDNRVIVERVCV
jgi:hypothetical protein